MGESVTIGFVAKDRYHVGPSSLRRLLDATDMDFDLIVIDPATPPHYWRQMEEVLADVPDARVIRTEHYPTLGESKNLVVENSRTSLTCIIENDVFVSDGWLSRLTASLARSGADVVAPLILEGASGRHHEDQNLGLIEFTAGGNGRGLNVRRLASSAALDRMTEPQRVEVAETHCLLFRTDIARNGAVFDPFINMQDFTDIGLSLKAVGASFYLDPVARVTIMPPPDVFEDERDFFMTTWDADRARRSVEHVQQKWKLDGLPPGSAEWILERHHSLNRRMHLLYQVRYLLTRRWKRIPGSAARRLRERLAIS